MEWKEEKHKTIFSQRLAGYLMLRGFVLMDMRRDVKDGKKNVFYFKNSPELRGAIDEYDSKFRNK